MDNITAMKKVILINSCRECPYSVCNNADAYCKILQGKITRSYIGGRIEPDCPLDDAMVESEVEVSKAKVISEGVAVCKIDSERFKEAVRYRFKRQADGVIRIYMKKSNYSMMSNGHFSTLFNIVDEKSLIVGKDINTNKCSRCERPLRWCECD